MTKVNGLVLAALTVGQVAEQFDVTVRTLHHYDEIGLLVPSQRTPAGYRLYADKDIAHLRRQRAAVMSRLDEMQDLVTAIDRALEKEMSGIKLTKEEQKELFGDGFGDDYAQEAEQRWGDTEAWKQSQARTGTYTKADWVEVKAEMDANNAAFVSAMTDGEPATSERAMDAAEAHRLHIHNRFYDLTPEFHRGLGDMYVADPRFTKTHEDIGQGLAQYVRDAIHGNSDRAAHAAGSKSWQAVCRARPLRCGARHTSCGRPAIGSDA